MPDPVNIPSPGRRAGLLAGLLVLSILLIAPFARPEGQPREDYGPKLSSVEIHDFEKDIDILIREADEAAASGDYEKATELYQEAARSAPRNYVVRVASRTYLGARELVKSRIAAWPQEGIRTYRKLTAPRIRDILNGALARGDVGALRRIAREFPHSEEAPAVMLQLGTRALSRGDLDLALRHLLEILRLYPEGAIPGIERQDVLARGGLAAAKLGDRLLLDEFRERAGRLPAVTAVVVAGETRMLSEFLGGLAIVSPGELAPQGWTGVGGSSSRRGGKNGPTGALTRYFTWPELSSGFEDGDRNQPDEGKSKQTPLHPLIGAGHIILPGRFTIRGFSLPAPGSAPGKPKAGKFWSVPSEELEAAYVLELRDIPVFGAIADGLLTVPYRDPSMDIEFPGDTPRDTLLSIDIETAKLLGQRGGTDPRHEELPDGLEFCGAPAITNGRVYVTGFRTRHLVETFVFCFDSGGRRGGLRLRWTTSVCMGQGQSSQRYSGWFGDAQRMEASSVTIRNGLAYLCSNTGAVAALEADTGEIVWLHTYEQAKRRTNLYTREERTTTTWFPNPPMLDHRLLYVTPRDADRLFIYHQRPDLETGYIVHDHFGRDQIVNGFDPEYMIGVRDGVVFLAGSSRTRGERPLFAVKSGPLAPAGDGDPADQQRILWRAEIEEDAPSGRGVLAGEAIYFPTEKGIYRVSIADGAVTRLLDISDFPDEEDPDWVAHPIGNLAVSGPWLLTASKDAVSLFGPPPDEGVPDKGDRGQGRVTPPGRQVGK